MHATEQCELCGGLYKHADSTSAKYLCEFKPRQAITTPPITKRLVAPGYRPKQFQKRPKYLLWWSEHFLSVTLRAYNYIWNRTGLGLGDHKVLSWGKHIVWAQSQKYVSTLQPSQFCLLLSLKNWYRMYFSNAYESSKFPQGSLFMNILIEFCWLISFIPFYYLLKEDIYFSSPTVFC